MISCTEFIPLYSEFFKYLESKGGQEAVLKYWYYISDNSIGDKTNPNSMAYKCERLGGFEGAKAYWAHTLTEEACDLLEIDNDEKRYHFEFMRHCPSRGMLNELKHIEPYHNYCGHCKVIYSRVLEKYGIVYDMDHTKICDAQCTGVLYEKGNEPPFDFHKLSLEDIERLKNDENTKINDMKSEDNKYLHRDFHLLGDLALKYCGEQFGDEGVLDFLTSYTKNYYAPKIKEFQKNGLKTIEKWIKNIYDIEEASEVIHTDLSGSTLTVTIDKSPVIEYMRSLNQEPTKYYIEETRTLYYTIAKESGFKFKLEYYNKDGGAKFVFSE